MAKWFAGVLVVVLVLLQYRMWLSDDGVSETLRLAQAVESQKTTNDGLRERNAQLAAEVADLKDGFSALEERARSELGMIAPDETFYQVVPRAAQTVAPAPSATAAPARSAQR